MPLEPEFNKKRLARLLEGFKDKLVFDESLLEAVGVFMDRVDGGKKLADLVRKAGLDKGLDLVLAIPCGGVPVGFELALELELPMDLIIVRKILIPWNTEAGYGAVSPDGEYVLNEPLRAYLGFTDDEVREHVRQTYGEVKRRETIFRNDRGYDFVSGHNVLLVDDGIASGYTMLAAIDFLREKGVNEIFIGAPTASLSGIGLLYDKADYLIIPNIRSGIPFFAVADAYVLWYDLSDDEVLEYIDRARKKGILPP